jgi:hypothetical protein
MMRSRDADDARIPSRHEKITIQFVCLFERKLLPRILRAVEIAPPGTFNIALG